MFVTLFDVKYLIRPAIWLPIGWNIVNKQIRRHAVHAVKCNDVSHGVEIIFVNIKTVADEQSFVCVCMWVSVYVHAWG